MLLALCYAMVWAQSFQLELIWGLVLVNQPVAQSHQSPPDPVSKSVCLGKGLSTVQSLACVPTGL